MKSTKIKNSVRRFRFEHNEMTQQELANRIGVTRQTIIAIESGKYIPSLTNAFEMARVFGVSIEDLFHYEKKEALEEE